MGRVNTVGEDTEVDREITSLKSVKVNIGGGFTKGCEG